ncbi:hypothetical protein KEM55_002163 [Ascosphaera atra]|nr:hypothetical protein KEM55_002163 [Ascosphaera atra]
MSTPNGAPTTMSFESSASASETQDLVIRSKPSVAPTRYVVQPPSQPFAQASPAMKRLLESPEKPLQGKKTRATWPDAAIEAMLREMIRLRSSGFSSGSTVNNAGWHIIRETLKNDHGLDVSKAQIRHKLQKLKEEYSHYKLFCKATSGVMDTFCSQERHAHFSIFHHRRPHFENLVAEYFTGSSATGDYARGIEDIVNEIEEEEEERRLPAGQSSSRQRNIGAYIESAARILATAPAEDVSVQREAFQLFAKEKERVCPVGWKNDEGRVGSLYVPRVIRMFQDDFFVSLFVEMVSCPGFDLDELQLLLLDEYTAKWES